MQDAGNHFIDSERTITHTRTTILVIELPTQEGTSKGVVIKLSKFLKHKKDSGPEGVIIEIKRQKEQNTYKNKID